MANDLVRQQGWPEGEMPDEWDRPPLAENNGRGPVRQERDARDAERDASHARVRGDHTFAVQREADAGDLRQKRWDWGDLRTWVWIAAMCLGFLVLVAFVYYLPYGRHNQTDGPKPTPDIRVY